MTAYFLSFFWGICLIFSLVGWGAAINRVLFPKHPVDWGQRAAWGLAFSICLGGVLNWTESISRTAILLFVGLGTVLYVVVLYRQRAIFPRCLFPDMQSLQKDRLFAVGFLLICFLSVVRYAGSVAGPQRASSVWPIFNKHDDFHAYFVFSNKMLQTGSLGPDPFSERRMTSSLGGQWFLDCFVLSVLSERNLHLVDQGLGLWIVLGLLWGFFREIGTSPKIAILILLFVLLIPPPAMNISTLVVGLALFLSLFRTLAWRELGCNHFGVSALIIALIAAALCASKSTLVPACGAILALSYFFHIAGSSLRREAATEFALATLLVVLFLLPWMISMYESSGTFLYPLLGKGYYGSAHGTGLDPYAELSILKSTELLGRSLSTAQLAPLFLLGTFGIWARRRKIVGREPSMSLLLGAIAGVVVMVLAVGGYGTYRYTFSFVFAAMLVWMTELTTGSLHKEPNKGNLKAVVIAALAAGMLLGSVWNESRHMYLDVIDKIRFGLQNKPLLPGKKAEQYRNMQMSVPAGETLLARLEYPFLLDFRRNQIFIVDWPGAASLPPGMPLFKGSEALADYLVSKSIRYVAYSYANGAGYSEKIAGPESTPWAKSQNLGALDFQANLRDLGETRKRVYDDGDIFILDLLQRRK